jgi:hypothetical protein
MRNRLRGRAAQLRVMAELRAHLGRRASLPVAVGPSDRNPSGRRFARRRSEQLRLMWRSGHARKGWRCAAAPRAGSSARQLAPSGRQVTIRIRFRQGARVREEGQLHHRL